LRQELHPAACERKDATLDGIVDFNDLVHLAQNYNTTVSTVTDSWWYNGDFTYDGIVDFNDLVKLAQNYNTKVSDTTDGWWTHGDFTYDGVTDFNDLVKLAQNYNVITGVEPWTNGDFTYDGNVDFNDLVKLAQNYNATLPTDPVSGAPANFQTDLATAFATVPEPSAISLNFLSACALAARRRRHCKPPS